MRFSFSSFFANTLDYTHSLVYFISLYRYEMGGAAFTLTMLWAQAMPFVALQLYDEDNGDVFSKENLRIFLMCCLGVWVLTTAAFFYSINFNYVNTFFGFATGLQYTCDRFQEASDDSSKFLFAFKKENENIA